MGLNYSGATLSYPALFPHRAWGGGHQETMPESFMLPFEKQTCNA